jgi:hypothetical protein
MARIAADRLVRRLKRSGYVVLKNPAAPGHWAPDSYGSPPLLLDHMFA